MVEEKEVEEDAKLDAAKDVLAADGPAKTFRVEAGGRFIFGIVEGTTKSIWSEDSKLFEVVE